MTDNVRIKTAKKIMRKQGTSPKKKALTLKKLQAKPRRKFI